jgi:oxalate decarboxylase/phosphoglucose isomerase-like protein (cupin superfamily)
MKRSILLLLLTAFLAAQSATEVEITAELHHHLVFENAQIRAFYVDISPHTDTLMHWHRHDYIYVMLGASEIVNSVEGKDPVPAKLQEAQAGFVPGGFAHLVHNLNQPYRNLTVEILDDKLREASSHPDTAHSDSSHPGSAKTEEDRGLEILPGGTKEILFVKDGIRVSEFELQPGGMIPMHKHTGPHLMVAVTDLDLQEHHLTDVHPPDLSHFMSGQVKWIPGGYSHTLTNSGKTPAKFVTLEFPSGTPK